MGYRLLAWSLVQNGHIFVGLTGLARRARSLNSEVTFAVYADDLRRTKLETYGALLLKVRGWRHLSHWVICPLPYLQPKPATGLVTIDGRPVSQAIVLLHGFRPFPESVGRYGVFAVCAGKSRTK